MPRCHECGINFDRAELIYQQVLKGHTGRRKNGEVLMCYSCSNMVQSNDKIVAGITLSVMAVIILIMYLARAKIT